MVPERHSPASELPSFVPASEAGDGPVSTLRGAGVEADLRRTATVIGMIVLVGFMALSGVLFVVGARKNAQIEALRDHGTPVAMTVTGCLGLMGGSGSNAAGYACAGTYTVDGRRYHAGVPGIAPHTTGQKVPVLTVADDPSLVSSARLIAVEHPSGRVYVVPSLLLGTVVLAAVVAMTRGVRRGRWGAWGASRDRASVPGMLAVSAPSGLPSDPAPARVGTRTVDWSLS